MEKNTEQILIIYSFEGTRKADLHATQTAIQNFSQKNSNIKFKPLVFEVPSGAAPGSSLGTELSNELSTSVGAIIFIDDLRPNVAYELGFFHGKGRTVLLLTRNRVDSIWNNISDLAGAALASLETNDLTDVVHAYLLRIYNEICFVRVWPTFPLPSKEANFLNNIPTIKLPENLFLDGQFGTYLKINSWERIEVDLGFNLLPNARFMLLLKAEASGDDYTVYFKVRFSDRHKQRQNVWLGLTSTARKAWLTYSERTLPAQNLTREWRILTGEFDQLLEHGSILGGCSVDYVDRARFRAGSKEKRPAGPITIGYFSINGIDN